MNNPEDEADNPLNQIIEQVWTKWTEEGPPEGSIYLPEEVLAVVDTLGPPSWKLLQEALAGIDKEQLFRDVERLFKGSRLRL
ncbi:MAG: hypothetical protein JO331_02310 [Verrucomicrobia bacterium]|nr:hypothetical protein [Verrucomicrobiota bacterium]